MTNFSLNITERGLRQWRRNQLRKGGNYEYLINYWCYYPGFVAAGFYLLPQFRLADPYSPDYWSYSRYHLATADCVWAILSFIHP